MSYVSLLRQRPVLVLWLAETLSVFGDRFFTLALAWTAWQKSGAVAMGLVVVVESVPHLLIGTFGRKLVARFASFRALAGVEAVQILVVGAMPWLWQSLGLTGVLVVIVLVGTCDAVTGPSLSALVPGMVDKNQVRQVTGLMDVSNRLTWFLGPGSAAVLLSLMSAEKLFLIDAATFTVSALAFAWLGRAARPLLASPSSTADGEGDAERAAPKALAVLRANPRIGGALVLGGIGEFFSTVLTIGIPIWLTSQLHAGASAYALVLSAMGVGAVIGNLLTGNVALPGRFPGGYCLVWAARGVLLGAFAFSSTLVQIVVIAAAASALVPLTAISLNAEIGSLPGPERLRLFTVDSVKIHVASMSSMLLLPALLERAPRASFAAGGALTAAAGVLAWAAARMWCGAPAKELDRAELARR
ncbi:MFS transporter (plasmid) [Streptomyces alboflavus]|uniref:MFS transporter n=1 Tax=Streptomyces alboflavus TaxID=67267 RepID=A0A291W3W7_9ACTN|nr:MFS transporter [Streptomyces alboflavus]ATM24708.1 MFS transporter [Streptomyces alboflavus]